MDPLFLIWVGVVAVLILVLFMVGRYYPGSGLNEIGMRSAREIAEQREALEAEDLDQMIAAHNARRRARGQSEVTAGELELRVAADMRDQEVRRDAYLADNEFDQLLEATNARRRAKGQPPRTREEALREFGGASSDD